MRSKQLWITTCPLEDTDINCSPIVSKQWVEDDWPVNKQRTPYMISCTWDHGYTVLISRRMEAGIKHCGYAQDNEIVQIKRIFGIWWSTYTNSCVTSGLAPSPNTIMRPHPPLIWASSLPVEGLQSWMVPGPTLVTRLPRCVAWSWNRFSFHVVVWRQSSIGTCNIHVQCKSSNREWQCKPCFAIYPVQCQLLKSGHLTISFHLSHVQLNYYTHNDTELSQALTLHSMTDMLYTWTME